MASKSVIVFAALVAVAAAVDVRDKRQIFLNGLAPLPLPLARAVIPPALPVGEDDGSWAPNKYDAIEVPVAAPWAAPLAAPLAPLAGLGFRAALPWAAPIAPLAPLAPLALQDDGSYWSGKYGPENIQDISALASL